MSNTLKNKHWLKIGIMILALCFCLSGICGTALADAIDRERFSILEASQQDALEAYEKIWNSFESDSKNRGRADKRPGLPLFLHVEPF